ncbi:MAG: type II secretion system protein GspL [Gammaproteobacteria bacterium]|nr:type II secretion system protein GspL [Gammaproteobacteria bacterium]
MADHLVIYLKDLHALSCDWTFSSDSGEPSTPLCSGTVSELADKNKNRLLTLKNISCIIPSELVHLSYQNIPAKNKQRALQALPFVLEDQLAEDIEQLHFAISNATNNVYPVAAIRHATMISLLSRLDEFHIYPSAVYADISCLPHTTACWNILCNENGICIDQHTDSVIHTDAEFFPQIIANLLSPENNPSQPDCISVYSASDATDVVLADSINKDINVIQYKYETSPVIHFLKLNNRQLINLRQGTYKVVNQSNQWWQVWRAAAFIAIAAIALELSFGIIQLNRLSTHNELLESEIINIYKSSFPLSKRIVNARVQMESKLKQLRKGGSKSASGFTDILLETAPVLNATNGMTISAISYNNDKLQLSFTIDKLSSVESLKQRLNQSGHIKAELISSSSEARQVNAQISIEVI